MNKLREYFIELLHFNSKTLKLRNSLKTIRKYSKYKILLNHEYDTRYKENDKLYLSRKKLNIN